MTKPVCLITGCSSGFGVLFTKRLSKTHHVYATMRDLGKKKDLETQLNNEELSSISILQCDVTEISSIERVIKEIENEEGRLDVLINNAGFGLGGFFEDLEEQEIRDQFETNFFGLQSVTRHSLPLLRQTKGAKIINLSSIAGIVGTPGLSAYNASKWAVEGFSESLYFELYPFDVKVILVEPGPYNTKVLKENAKLSKKMNDKKSPYYENSQKLISKLDKLVKHLLEDPDIVARLVGKIVKQKNPKFRHVIGKTAVIRYLLKRFTSFRFYSWLIRLVYMK
ncbi:short-chain dehydrogenase [Candidatus Marinamargulisbacteria bacterium SCGC AAA071-K20]|nr:short-chain dehydrogenase [Candidatus Marinamargulisbacteria bacterium SCGC AAA071-K20]